MSYCADLKQQLAERDTKKKCCRHALLYGILSVRGVCLEGEEVAATLPAGAVADLFVTELAYMGLTPAVRAIGKSGARVSVTVKSAELYAHVAAGDFGYPEEKKPCERCLSSFLRGVFLAVGRISDITKGYRLEFSAGEHIDDLAAVRTELFPGRPPKRILRKGENILYYKTSGEICDILAFIGAEGASFELMNETIKASYRASVNRRMNCELRNIHSSVTASGRVVELIRRLVETDKLKRLPEDLRETALLRLENTEISLAALGRRCTPSVTKSGMNHRLERIERLALELLREEG